MPKLTRPVWRVMAMDPVRRVWTVRGKPYSVREDAKAQAEAMKHKDPTLRVRIAPGNVPVLTVVPPVISETRKAREAEAQRLSDLADANKRYKSPG